MAPRSTELALPSALRALQESLPTMRCEARPSSCVIWLPLASLSSGFVAGRCFHVV